MLSTKKMQRLQRDLVKSAAGAKAATASFTGCLGNTARFASLPPKFSPGRREMQQRLRCGTEISTRHSQGANHIKQRKDDKVSVVYQIFSSKYHPANTVDSQINSTKQKRDIEKTSSLATMKEDHFYYSHNR